MGPRARAGQRARGKTSETLVVGRGPDSRPGPKPGPKPVPGNTVRVQRAHASLQDCWLTAHA